MGSGIALPIIANANPVIPITNAMPTSGTEARFPAPRAGVAPAVERKSMRRYAVTSTRH